MKKWGQFKLQDFLATNPKLRLTKLNEEGIILNGEYDFHAKMEGFEALEETYSLSIYIPKSYPKTAPIVKEVGGIIPRNQDHHVNGDGTLCLGARIILLQTLSNNPSLLDFAQNILTPFLYSISYKMKFGALPYGDLSHEEAGLVEAYEELFNVRGKQAVIRVLKALGSNKRIANKLLCPCGCNKRLGLCNFRFSLKKWRAIASRRWYREHLQEDFRQEEGDKKQFK